jgi:MFS family permease
VTGFNAIGARTFVSLKQHRNYRLFFIGQIVSVSGTWMQNIAMYWLVLQLTNSAVAVGVLSFARFAPAAVLAPFAGTLADRLDNRRTVMATQVVQMVLASLLTILVFGGGVRPWHMYGVAALMGTVHCLDAATRANLTYQLVGRQELSNAVALNNTLFNAARVGGPVVGGVVITAVGVEWCFALNTVTFLAVLTSLASMRASELFPLARQERPRMFAGTREGLVYVRSQPDLFAVLTLITVYATLLFNMDVLLPILTRQTLHRGAGTFALLMSLFGVGALVGSLSVAWKGKESWRTAVVAAACLAVLEISIAPLRSAAAVGVLLLLAGVSFAVLNAHANALLQMKAPDHLRGRILSLYMYAWMVFAPLGSVFIAWLCATRGTTVAFTVIGLTGLVGVGAVQWRLRRANEAALAVD